MLRCASSRFLFSFLFLGPSLSLPLFCFLFLPLVLRFALRFPGAAFLRPSPTAAPPAGGRVAGSPRTSLLRVRICWSLLLRIVAVFDDVVSLASIWLRFRGAAFFALRRFVWRSCGVSSLSLLELCSSWATRFRVFSGILLVVVLVAVISLVGGGFAVCPVKMKSV